MVDAAFLLGYAAWRVRRRIQRKPDTDPPHLLIDSIRQRPGRENRQRAAEARSDQHDGQRVGRPNRRRHLFKHPCHRQRTEVRLVEVGASKRHAVGTQPFGEKRGLGRLRPGCESVQVEDRHECLTPNPESQ